MPNDQNDGGHDAHEKHPLRTMNTFDITIAGEINLDLILYGLPQQMPVERELIADGFRATLGSSSAILAHNLSALGAQVGFITASGGDELGRMALKSLEGGGVDLSRAVIHPSIGTGVTAILPHGDNRHIITYLGTISTLRFSDLDLGYLKSSRHFHLSSLYLQTALAPDVPKLFRELKAAGLTISLDTNDDPEGLWGPPFDEILPLVDIFLPNEREILGITKANTVEEAIDLLSSRVPCIAVKCGKRGCMAKMQDRLVFAQPIPVTPVDTIGAGDSFNAGFLYAWLLGLGLDECARAGNITGSLSTLRSGGTEAFRDTTLLTEFLKTNNFPRGAAHSKQGPNR